MNTLRADLPPVPSPMSHLPVDVRGYPIPWFVAELEDGTRDFRVADADKRRRAVEDSLCWVCGKTLGRYQIFVLGPMCTVTRTTSEPAMHRECAEFSVKACPFLTLPKAQYRSANLPLGVEAPPGEFLTRNPGVSALWQTRHHETFGDGRAGWLIQVGRPTRVDWYTCGRLATRVEVIDSLRRGLPTLQSFAAQDGDDALAEFWRCVGRVMPYLPHEAVA